MTDHGNVSESRLDPGRVSGPEASVAPGNGVDESEAELMHQIAAGELSALESLYDRYRSTAYALALRVTGDVGLAEDVVQDSFVGVWRNAGRYAETRGSVRGWLLAVVRHRSIDVLRRRRNDTALAESEDPVTTPAVLTVPDIWPEVAGHLDAQQVRIALGTLPVAQRQTLELAYFEGLTQREIAQRVGVPLGTVKSRMRLGLLALRRELLDTVTVSEGGAGTEDVGSRAGRRGGRATLGGEFVAGDAGAPATAPDSAAADWEGKGMQ